jgi:hypothetical protein
MRASISLAALLPFLVVSGAAKADLIVNGSFESRVIPNGTQAEFTGDQIPGWTIFGGNGQIFNTTYQEGGVTFNAQSGNQSIDISGTTNNPGQGISQTVATQIGREYQLSFYLGNPAGFNPDTGAVVDLSIDNGLPVSYVNGDTTPGFMNWKHFSVDFVATSGSTTLEFTYGSSPPNYVSALDNVTLSEVSERASLNAVPEPASLTFLGIAMVSGVVGRAWFRSRSC